MTPKQPRPNFITLVRSVPLYAFLLAIYPIVSLLAFNISQVYARDAIMPLLITIALTAILLGLARLVSGNWLASGYLVSLAAIWFFTYGHVYNQIKGISLGGVLIGRHRYLLIVWTGIFLFFAVWMLLKRRTLPNWTWMLNIISSLLVGISAVQIGAYYIKDLVNAKPPETADVTPLISWTEDSTPPDIYYIILDGYPRADVLKEGYGLDNSAFLDSLRQMGFRVADCSQSNYTRTLLSLTSTFNMDYLQSMHPELTPDQDTSLLVPELKNNLVRQQLEQLGYKTIVFTNPWEVWVWDDADIVYRPSGTGVLSPFEHLLFSTTVARIYFDRQNLKNTQHPYYTNYVDTLYALRQLRNVPEIPGPKFVFAHLVIPHSPFVFGSSGEMIDIRPYDTVNNRYTKEDGIRGTTAAVTYIDSQMLEILPRLIEDSRTPPIIILASDHGAGIGGSETTVKNLEAFLFPRPATSLYGSITPVNIFRLVFEEYFNGSFDLLPDRSYYSAGGQYFNFQEMPNTCNLP